MSKRLAHQEMVAAVEQLNMDVALEDQHDVRASKEEIAHLLTTADGLPYMKRLQPVA